MHAVYVWGEYMGVAEVEGEEGRDGYEDVEDEEDEELSGGGEGGEDSDSFSFNLQKKTSSFYERVQEESGV
jgi:hypothetical protein